MSRVEYFEFADAGQYYSSVIYPVYQNLKAGALSVSDTILVENGPEATVTWSIDSNGDLDSWATTTNLVIATAPDYAATVQQLANVAVAPLTTGTSQSFTASFDATGLAAGTYYIAAMADDGGLINERSESDNLTNWVAITIEDIQRDLAAANIGVDLAASDLDLDLDLDGNATLSLSYVIENLGNDWLNTQTDYTVFLSTDGLFSADDLILSSGSTSLLPGQAVTIQDSVTIAEGLARGDYFIGVSVETLDDTDTTNNLAVAAVTLQDSVIRGTESADSLSGTASDDIIKAYGGDDYIYVATGNDTIDGGAGIDTVRLSGYRFDYDITQIDDVTVQVSGPDGVDLISNVEYFQFSDLNLDFDTLVTPYVNLTAGLLSLSSDILDVETGQYSATWSIASNGDLDAGATSTRLVIATSPNLTNVVADLANVAVDPMQTGTSVTYTANIDASILEPGNYYVAAIADDANLLDELYETDNITNWVYVSAYEPTIDVAVTQIIAYQSAVNISLGPDASLDMNYTLSNVGQSLANTAVTYSVFLSTDTAYSQDDIVISTGSTTLLPGDSISISDTALLAETIVSGDYYIGITADTDGTDVTPFNNTLFSTSTITFYEGVLMGTDLDDLLQSTQYNEQIFALDGNDHIMGSEGSDIISGGAGIDTLDYSGLLYGIDVGREYPSSEQHEVISYSSQWTDVISDIEILIGTDFDDFILMGNENITDPIWTTTYTGAGNDTLGGTMVNDVLDGGSGDDFIIAYLGDDTIITGTGSDQIVFERMYSSVTEAATGAGNDIILDFDLANDIIYLQYYASQVETWTTAQPDALSLVTQTEQGALITYADDGSSVLLDGVDANLLSADNFLFDDGITTIPF